MIPCAKCRTAERKRYDSYCDLCRKVYSQQYRIRKKKEQRKIMFFDVWKAYKEACGGATLTQEDRIPVLQDLEKRIRESERQRIRQGREQQSQAVASRKEGK